MRHSCVAVVLALILGGCAPVMEAQRPDPVDLAQFAVGEPRLQVVGAIGAPTGSITDAGHPCDVYKLYTRGPNALGKGVIAVGEAAADVFTLGLSEVIFTPAEAATKNGKHTVIFCYDKDRLLSFTESEGTSE